MRWGVSLEEMPNPLACVCVRVRGSWQVVPPPHEGRGVRVRVPARTRAHARRGGPHPLYECACATIFRGVWGWGLTVALCFGVLGWWGSISWHSRSLPPGAGVSRWLWHTCSSRSCVVQVALALPALAVRRVWRKVWGSDPPSPLWVGVPVTSVCAGLTLAKATNPEWGGSVGGAVHGRSLGGSTGVVSLRWRW